MVSGLVLPMVSSGQNVDAARALLRVGAYEKAVDLAQDQVGGVPAVEAWRHIQLEGLMGLGRYPEAYAVATNAVVEHERSIRMWWRAREVFRGNGDLMGAAHALDRIGFYVLLHRDLYRYTPDQIVIGRAALAQGTDPKLVFDRVYKPAREVDPGLREIYLAAGDLALEKHDYALAAQWFRDGLEQIPEDPDLLWGLARAYAPSESVLMLESAAAALAVNPHHAGCLLLMADHQITAENYDGAEEFLQRVLDVNPWHPEAWAGKAVLAHLRNQPEAEESARVNALRFWPTNPRVDYLIGRKLSEKYRFVEGAACQYRALGFDPMYLPAKAQVASDLLRLGWEEEGWQAAEDVQRTDEYDVTANNLMTLRDVISEYAALSNRHFVVRMHPHEASLYGSRVLDLLSEAYQVLGDRYGLKPAQPTLVEIFKEQKDFAVRTFGEPLNQGYLGVCFGRVVTANSPGSRGGRPFNWESMLWHEYCHVVTLQLTKNKMPRWLSEGISVYEERSRNPAWGEQLTPAYRELLLSDELTPVSKLSAAFMTPRSGEHLMFAYYQSSLVVQFLVEAYGRESLLAILAELRDGMGINHAIALHAAPMKDVDRDFAEYARGVAHALAPGLDWTMPGSIRLASTLTEGKDEGLNARPPRERHPADSVESTTNFWRLAREAGERVADENFREAQPLLERLLELYPECIGATSAYRLLAKTHRALGESEQERAVLAEFAERDDEAIDAYQRLMELAAADADWEQVQANAERYLAVNPLIPLPYRYLSRAAQALGRTGDTITALRAQLVLDPANPAPVHYGLARALAAAGDTAAARRHVLLALEEAPRFREALALLLDLQQDGAPATEAPPSVEAPNGRLREAS